VLSQPFSVFCGVRQGGVLSPLMFNVYVDDLIRRLESDRLGCCINGIGNGSMNRYTLPWTLNTDGPPEKLISLACILAHADSP